MIIEAMQCKLNSFLSHNVAHNRLYMYLLCDEIFMPQNGGTLRSAVITLMALFSYFGLLPCLWVHGQFKSNENPANGRGVLLMFLWS